jgi:hypothetical protein
MNLDDIATLNESRVKLNADGCSVLPLEYPIKDGQTVVSELVFRRPKLKDVEWAATLQGPSAPRMLTARLNMNGVSQQALEELDAYDATQAKELVQSFFARPRPTGQKP